MLAESQSTQLIADRYQLLGLIGSGGMGAVYHIVDRLTGETIALKHVMTDLDSLEFSTSQTATHKGQALAKEFQMLASLRHPHIVSVLDYGFDSSRQPFFTMEFLYDAKDIVSAAQFTTLSYKIQLIIDMLYALMYLHRRGILHRDLKPGNVMVTAQGVKVLDFGLSVSIEELKQQGNSISGTLAYMPPETLSGRGITPASDLYAVGVMAYEILAGRHPFAGVDYRQLINEILTKDPDYEVLPVSDALKAVIRRLMEKNPHARYQDAYSVIVALSEATGLPVPVESPSLRESFIQAARFVGRESEISQLIQALDAASESKGSGWLIGGESGVGKSRLLNEVRTEALVRGALVLRGQTVEDGGLPYQVWREPIRRALLSVPVSDLEAAILKNIIPDIATLLGREVDDAPLLEGSLAAQRIANTIGEVLKRLTVPCVLILEDLQWGQSALLPLQLLLNDVAERPMLILATYRNDEAPNLPEQLPQMRPMPLQRLSREAVQELTLAMLGHMDNAIEVIDILHKETEGNAFFLVEVVRALAEETGRVANLGIVSVPADTFTGGVRQVVTRRLGRMPDSYHPLLGLAAVCGRRLDRELLSALRPEFDYEAFVQAGTEAAILEVQDEGVQFVHDKLREGAMEGLSAEQRQNLHTEVGTALEQLYGDNPDYAIQLAHHWRQANHAPKERFYAHRAGHHYMGLGIYREGISFLERYNQINTESDLEKLGTYFRLSAAYMTIDGDKFVANVEQGLSLASELKNLDYRLMYLSRISIYYALFQLDLEKARPYLTEGEALATQVTDPAALCTWYLNIGNVYLHSNRLEEALPALEQGLALARQARVANDENGGLFYLGTYHFLQGLFETARDYFQQAYTNSQRLGNLHLSTLSLAFLALCYMEEEDTFEQAKQHTADALILAQRSNNFLVLSTCHNIMARIALFEGNTSASKKHIKQTYHVMTRTQNLNHKLTVMSLYAHQKINNGQYQEALVILYMMQSYPALVLHLYHYLRRLIQQAESQLTVYDIAEAKQQATQTNSDELVAEFAKSVL